MATAGTSGSEFLPHGAASFRIEDGAAAALSSHASLWRAEERDVTLAVTADAEELSGIGAAYAAGRGLGLYGDEVFTRLKRQEYAPKMCEEVRVRKYNGWKDAVKSVLK